MDIYSKNKDSFFKGQLVLMARNGARHPVCWWWVAHMWRINCDLSIKLGGTFKSIDSIQIPAESLRLWLVYYFCNDLRSTDTSGDASSARS